MRCLFPVQCRMRRIRRTRRVVAKGDTESQHRKQQTAHDEDTQQSEPATPAPTTTTLYTESFYNSQAKLKLQKQLAFRSDQFLLNQILLGIQIFGNYEREMTDGVELNRNLEDEKLAQISKYCKSVILPDRLHEAIDRNVRLKSRSNSGDNVKWPSTKPIHNRTMFIVYDNIELLNADDSSLYSNLTTLPVTKLEIELISVKQTKQTKQNKQNGIIRAGFVRLKTPTTVNQLPDTPDTDYDYTYLDKRSTMTNDDERPLPLPPSQLSPPQPPPQTQPPVNDELLRNLTTYSNNSKSYLNAKLFFNDFLRLFRDKLAQSLKIDDGRDLQITDNYIVTTDYRIMPAIFYAWPHEAIEWMYRERTVHENPFTRQRFLWPTQTMINKVVSFGCHVIPNRMAKSDFEWRIVFPTAERYLESSLTSAQTKVYALSKALYQMLSFDNADMIDDATSILRNHLFWQCEENFAAWSEDFLGEALLRYWRTLLDQVKRKRMPDYFMPERNLFRGVPERSLVELHTRIYRFLENPVPYAVNLVRSLQFVTTDFYPLFHVNVLYKMLVASNLLPLMNPKIDAKYLVTGESVKLSPTIQQPDEFVDVAIPLPKYLGPLRRKLVFDFFIAHFMNMARHAVSEFGVSNLALIYSRQIERLCSILKDDQHGDDADTYLGDIETVKADIRQLANRNIYTPAPKLPQRENSNRQMAPGGRATGLPQSNATVVVVDVHAAESTNL